MKRIFRIEGLYSETAEADSLTPILECFLVGYPRDLGNVAANDPSPERENMAPVP